MVEQINAQGLRKLSVPGSGVYYVSTVTCTPKLFFKKPAIKGVAIVEALISSFLGYIEDVKEFGYIDYSLCKIGDVYANYTNFVSGFEDIIPVLAQNSHLFKCKDKDNYQDIIDYMLDGDKKDTTLVVNKFKETCRVLSIITSSPVEFVERYFRVLMIIDFLVSNGDRTFDNISFLNTEKGLMLSPYFDFGSSLCCTGKDNLNISAGPFSKFHKLQLNAADAFNNPITIDFDRFINYIQDFKIKDSFQMRVFMGSLGMLQESCARWKGKLWVQK